MLAGLLSFGLSSILSMVGPGLLVAAAGWLFLQRQKAIALILLKVAGIWFAAGIVYQEGASYVQRQVDAAVAEEKERRAIAIADAVAGAGADLKVRAGNIATREAELAAYAEELAARPNAMCIGTDADFRRLR